MKMSAPEQVNWFIRETLFPILARQSCAMSVIATIREIFRRAAPARP